MRTTFDNGSFFLFKSGKNGMQTKAIHQKIKKIAKNEW